MSKIDKIYLKESYELVHTQTVYTSEKFYKSFDDRESFQLVLEE
jgi:hypothetical protein